MNIGWLPDYPWDAPLEPDWGELDDLDQRLHDSECAADKRAVQYIKYRLWNSSSFSRVAASVSIRQSATETPAEFVQRIALAVLEEVENG